MKGRQEVAVSSCWRADTGAYFWADGALSRQSPKDLEQQAADVAQGSKSGPCVDLSCPFLYKRQTRADSSKVSHIPRG